MWLDDVSDDKSVEAVQHMPPEFLTGCEYY